MIAGLTYDFSVDKENRTILIMREFPAPLQQVWDAYTQSEMLDQWWAPKPWKAVTKEFDFREGGRWLYAMRGPKGEEQWAVATFSEIQPQESFSVDDAFADQDGNVNTEMPASKWEVAFSEKGRNTMTIFRITFDDVHQLDETLEMGFREGLTMAMDNLEELLTRNRL